MDQLLLLDFLIIWATIRSSRDAMGMRLNTTGFEGCIFHVVDADGGLSHPTKDLIESIVTRSSGSQPWTVSTLKDSTKIGPLVLSFELEERCSANILVQLEPAAYLHNMYHVFGLRVVNPKAILILIAGQDHYQLRTGVGDGVGDFLITHLFFYYLDPGSSRIRDSYAFCGRCSKASRIVESSIQPTNLLAMKEFSEQVREGFRPRTLLASGFQNSEDLTSKKCRSWYPKVYSFLDGHLLVCEPNQIFLQNLAHQLNATREYADPSSQHRVVYWDLEPPTGLVTVDMYAWSATSPVSILHWYIRDTAELRFLYCRMRVERESFSFYFWAKPFDVWSWALIGLVLFGLTLVSKGQWLEAFGAIFARQSISSLNSNKFMILFLFAAILFTSGYESIISSLIIVPPSPIVVRNLKHLVDSGYRIFGFDNAHADNTTILLILKRENISHSSLNEPPFIPNTYRPSLTVAWDMFSKCNATSLVSYSVEDDVYQDQLDLHYARTGISCHIVRETKYPTERLITYSGYSVTTFHAFLNSLQESGILDMLYKFWLYVDSIQVRIDVEKKKYAEGKTEVPFELRDPKIISIFVGCGVLLFGASLTFLSESLLVLLANLYALQAAIPLFRN